MARKLVSVTVALLGSGMLLSGGALAAENHSSAKAKTRQQLLDHGYRAPMVRCRARRDGDVCRWRADRRGFRHCWGRAAVDGRSGRARIKRKRCRALLLGFNEWVSAQNAELQDQIGSPVRRMFVPWRMIEPSPGVFNWSEYDQIYRLLRDRGLRPMLSVGTSPCWTRIWVQCSHLYEGPPDPTFDWFWQRYVRAVAERYPAAVGIEIWNDPNFTPMFQPQVDPARYVELLRIAYQAVKSVSSMPVSSGGLFATPVSGPGGMADDEFLAAMYRNGAARFMDAIATRPYPISPEEYDPALVAETFARLRAVRNAAGDRATPFWVTETGASTTTGPGFPPALTEAEQSQLLVGMLRGFIRRWDIPLVILHRLVDSPRIPAATVASHGTHLLGFGVYYPIEEGLGAYLHDGAPKELACDLAYELRGSLSC